MADSTSRRKYKIQINVRAGGAHAGSVQGYRGQYR